METLKNPGLRKARTLECGCNWASWGILVVMEMVSIRTVSISASWFDIVQYYILQDVTMGENE